MNDLQHEHRDRNHRPGAAVVARLHATAERLEDAAAWASDPQDEGDVDAAIDTARRVLGGLGGLDDELAHLDRASRPIVVGDDEDPSWAEASRLDEVGRALREARDAVLLRIHRLTRDRLRLGGVRDGARRAERRTVARAPRRAPRRAVRVSAVSSAGDGADGADGPPPSDPDAARGGASLAGGAK